MLDLGRLVSIGIFLLCTGGSTNFSTYAPMIVASLLNSAATQSLKSAAFWRNMILAGLASGYALRSGGDFESHLLYFLIFSSFIVPTARFRVGPKHAGPVAATLIWSAVVLTWMHEGLDSLCLGLVFFHGIPEIHRMVVHRRWGIFLVNLCVVVFFAPVLALVLVAMFREPWLEYFPPPLIKSLGFLIGAGSDVPDYYAHLGLSRGANERTIKSMYRKLALQYHPDKVGDDPVAREKLYQLQNAMETLTSKKREEYDSVLEATGLQTLLPRSVVACVMFGIWFFITAVVTIQRSSNRKAHKKRVHDSLAEITTKNRDMLVRGIRKELQKQMKHAPESPSLVVSLAFNVELDPNVIATGPYILNDMLADANLMSMPLVEQARTDLNIPPGTPIEVQTTPSLPSSLQFRFRLGPMQQQPDGEVSAQDLQKVAGDPDHQDAKATPAAQRDLPPNAAVRHRVRKQQAPK